MIDYWPVIFLEIELIIIPNTAVKKSILYFVLLSVSFVWASCDTGGVFYHQWEGEYLVKKTLECVYVDGTTETYDFSPREWPMFIFQDKGLFIQSYSYGIGEPYIPGVDSEEHILSLKSPRYIMLEDSGGIENVTDYDKIYVVVRSDGGVQTSYRGKVYSPKPIRVSIATSDKLVLANSLSFEAIITDESGQQIGTPICHWEYSPIQKQNEIYTWDADLHIKSENISGQLPVPIIMRNHFVLTKK